MISIPLLVQLAGAVPALMKYLGAGETTEKIATQAVELAKTVTGLTDPQQAVDRILQTPEAATEFQLKITQQMMDWDQLYLNDVANARARDIKLRELGQSNNRANWMITLDAIGLILCLFAMAVYSAELSEGILTLISTIASIFGLCLRDAHQFEFGTSRSSQNKDVTIKQLSTDSTTGAKS